MHNATSMSDPILVRTASVKIKNEFEKQICLATTYFIKDIKIVNPFTNKHNMPVASMLLFDGIWKLIKFTLKHHKRQLMSKELAECFV